MPKLVDLDKRDQLISDIMRHNKEFRHFRYQDSKRERLSRAAQSSQGLDLTPNFDQHYAWYQQIRPRKRLLEVKSPSPLKKRLDLLPIKRKFYLKAATSFYLEGFRDG